MKTSAVVFLVLLVLPGLLLSFHLFFTRTVDDSRFQINTDPDYAYLLSAIDLSRLDRSRMVLHPGTTVQVLSHLLMKARFGLLERRGDDFATSVLRSPGTYLNLLHHAFSLLNIGLVWLFGFLVYRMTRSLHCALLFQSLPLLFAPLAIFGFRKVSSDIVLVSAGLALAWLLLKTVHGRHPDRPAPKPLALALTFGLVVGFGMATKITFAVLAVIPLVVIPTLLGKAGFLLIAGISFGLFTLPVLSSFRLLKRFLLGIMTHRGIYGHGLASVFDPGDFIANLVSLGRENFPFILFLLVSLAVIIFSMVTASRRGGQVRKEADFKALAAVTLAQVMGVLMVARHFKSKYLIPVMSVTVVGFFFLDRNLDQLRQRRSVPGGQAGKRSRWRVIVFGLFIAGALLNSVFAIGAYHRQRQVRLREARMIEARLAGEFRGDAVVHFYNAASQVFGLKFGNDWTPLYAGRLHDLYGDQYFYNPLKRSITGWSSKERISIEQLREKHRDRIVFYGSPFSFLKRTQGVKAPAFPLRDVGQGRGITLYRLGK